MIGGFSIDITDKIESEKKYQDLYDVLASMLDTLPDMLWVYDKKKEIKFANKSIERKISQFECI